MTTETVYQAHYPACRIRRLGVEAGVRDVRVVHALDGVLTEVAPGQLTAVGGALWTAWCSSNPAGRPDLLLGLDAGGILPAVAVALASNLPYRLAWKVDLDLPHKQRFSEPHARRTHVFTYGDLADRRVLIVDDEVTTGHTLAGLVGVLRDTGAQVAGAVCLVEDTAGEGRQVLANLDVPLCALRTL
jgi:adenine phosphoribosyltransferase